MTTRRPPAGLARTVLCAALALTALGAAVPAGRAAAGALPRPDQIGRVCPPSSPNCGPELAAGAPAGPETLRNCPPGQPSCDPETVAGGGGNRFGYGGIGPAAIGGVCRPSSPNCGPDTVTGGGDVTQSGGV
ncbi:MAG TPA: hypothetical protein VNK05_01410 [Chloroflexota bacterium]|nr:hypothetical protein [Chloroflexota bacterium]